MPEMQMTYDVMSDCLYISRGDAKPCLREEVDGLIFGLTIEGAEPNGVTIPDFRERWSANLSQLAAAVERYLGYSECDVLDKLGRVSHE